MLIVSKCNIGSWFHCYVWVCQMPIVPKLNFGVSMAWPLGTTAKIKKFFVFWITFQLNINNINSTYMFIKKIVFLCLSPTLRTLDTVATFYGVNFKLYNFFCKKYMLCRIYLNIRICNKNGGYGTRFAAKKFSNRTSPWLCQEKKSFYFSLENNNILDN